MRKNPLPVFFLAAGLLITFIMALPDSSRSTIINPGAYAPLLSTIAKGESSGNYNAYYGQADNQSPRFTDMTIAQVLQWQEEFVRQGNPSSAVGKYQIVRPTLEGLVRQLNLDTSLKYDEAMQDRLAITLLERRGSVQFVDKKLSREEFAANLAQEWAALPKVVGSNPHESFYAGDGLNHSRVSVQEMLGAISEFDSSAMQD